MRAGHFLHVEPAEPGTEPNTLLVAVAGLCGHGGDRDRVGRAGTGGPSGSRTFTFPMNRSLPSPAPVRSRREGPRGHGDLVTFV